MAGQLKDATILAHLIVDDGVKAAEFYRDAFRMINRLKPTGLTVEHSFQTNGTLIDETWCTFFIEQRVNGPQHVPGPVLRLELRPGWLDPRDLVDDPLHLVRPDRPDRADHLPRGRATRLEQIHGNTTLHGALHPSSVPRGGRTSARPPLDPTCPSHPLQMCQKTEFQNPLATFGPRWNRDATHGIW